MKVQSLIKVCVSLLVEQADKSYKLVIGKRFGVGRECMLRLSVADV